VRGKWVRISADLDDDPRIVALPSDSARYAWVVTIGRGKHQPTPGTWPSEQHFAASLRRRARFLTDFLTAELMVRLADGSVKVRQWGEWQTDPTATLRQQDHRGKR
jgi:hypothetical protein